MTPVLRSESPDQPAILELIYALNAELDLRYPEEGANHFRLDLAEVAPGRGAFLVAYVEGIPVGCGATRLNDPHTAEIKRMYVLPAWRGRGIAGVVLAALEEHAKALGARELVLETGARQPESLAVYRRSGFREIERFGDYVDSPLSLCMGKTLA